MSDFDPALLGKNQPARFLAMRRREGEYSGGCKPDVEARESQALKVFAVWVDRECAQRERERS